MITMSDSKPSIKSRILSGFTKCKEWFVSKCKAFVAFCEEKFLTAVILTAVIAVVAHTAMHILMPTGLILMLLGAIQAISSIALLLVFLVHLNQMYFPFLNGDVKTVETVS